MAFTVTFVVNGGSEISPITYENPLSYGEIFKQASTTKEGYTFGGWYSAVDCIYACHPDSEVNASKWLYARWVPVDGRYSWYFNTLGRNDHEPNASFVNLWFDYCRPFSSFIYPTLWGKTINVIRFRFAKAGDFQLQVYPESASVPGTSGITPIATRDLTVPGTHSEDDIVTLMFEPLTIQPGQVVAITNSGTNLSPFKYVNSSGTIAVSDGNIMSKIGNGTTTTAGSPNIDIGYYDNSEIHVTGVDVQGPVKVAVDESITLTAMISPEDAADKQVSWSIVSGSSNVTIIPSNSSSDPTCLVNGIAVGNATIRATTNDGGFTSDLTVTVTSEHTYYVHLDSNGGSPLDDVEFNQTTPTFELPYPFKPNCHFVGWFEDQDLIGDITSAVASGTSRDISLKAKWIPSNVYNHFCGKSFTFVGDSVTTYWEDALDYPDYNIAYSQDVCEEHHITRNTTGYGQFLQAVDGSLKVLNAANYGGVSYGPRPVIMGANYDHFINNIGLSGDPDVIVILLGVNDLYTVQMSDLVDFDPNALYVTGALDTTTVFQENYDYAMTYTTMIRRIKDRYPSAEIVCVSSFKGNDAARNLIVEKGNQIVQDICNYYHLMHVNTAECEFHSGVYDGKEYTINGNVHPGNYGFKVLTEFVIQQLSLQLAATTTYAHLTKEGIKIQVDSAVRDGRGRKIETNYIRTVNSKTPVDGNVDVDLSGYYMKNETSSASEISERFLSCSQQHEDEAQARAEADEALSTSIDKKIWVSDRQVSSEGFSELSVIKLTQDEYAELLETSSVISNAIYIASSDKEDFYGERLQNVGDPEELSDAANKSYVDNAVSSSEERFSETASQLSASVDAKVYAGSISADEEDPEEMVINTEQVPSLSVLKIDIQSYGNLLSNETFSPTTMYQVDYEEGLLAYGMKIQYLADGTERTDAATVGQMNTAIAEALGDVNTILEALN